MLRENHREEFDKIYQELLQSEGVERKPGYIINTAQADKIVYDYIVKYRRMHVGYPAIVPLAKALNIGTSERIRKCILRLIDSGKLIKLDKTTKKGVGNYRLPNDED